MKKTIKLFGITALVAVMFAFVFIGCSDGGGSSTPPPDGDPTSATYTSYDGNVEYKLVIDKNPNRAAYNPQPGDSYKLTITPPGTTSTGTVKSVSGDSITLLKGESEFTVTISGTSISSFDKDIPVDDSETPVTKPDSANLTPTKPGNSGTAVTGAATLTISNEQVYTWVESNSGTASYPAFTGDRGLTGYYRYWDEDQQKEVFYNIGGSGSITNGKLSFTIGTPTHLGNIGDWFDYDGLEYTISDPSAKYCELRLTPIANANAENYDYGWLSKRYWTQSVTGSSSYTYTEAGFWYIYVDKNVTISIPAQTDEGSWEAEYNGVKYSNNWTETIKAHNLALKAGWNTVYMKDEGSGTFTGDWDDPISRTSTGTWTLTLDNPSSNKWVLQEY